MSFARATRQALGSSAVLAVEDAASLVSARRAVERELSAIDAACSRSRGDSDLARANAAAGEPIAIGPVLSDAVAVALRAARGTGGLVDPTIGAALVAAGYDRDFGALPADAPAQAPRRSPAGESCASTASAGSCRCRSACSWTWARPPRGSLPTAPPRRRRAPWRVAACW